jgi:hypothetical protein
MPAKKAEKALEAYEEASAEFIKSKKGKDQAAYRKAKDKLHKARGAWREARDAESPDNSASNGAVVRPDPVEPKTTVNE